MGGSVQSLTNDIPGLCSSEKRNFNLPYIYQNWKVQLLKSREQDKGFSGSQLSLSPLNTKCFWLPVQRRVRSLFLLCFPVHYSKRKELPTKCGLWCVCGGGVSLQLLLYSPSLSLFLNAPNFFFSSFGELPRKQSLLCSSFIWAIRFAGNLHKEALKREERLQCFANKRSAWEHIFLGGIISCWVCWGALEYLWQGKQMLGVNLKQIGSGIFSLRGDLRTVHLTICEILWVNEVWCFQMWGWEFIEWSWF